MMTLSDLPEDILYLLIQYLPVPDFLAFCASSKVFQQDADLRFSASYWRNLTRSTFRLPNQPVVAHDGRRWMSLYRRMRTQTKVFSWGNSDGGCLGGELVVTGPQIVERPRRGRVGGRFYGVRANPEPQRLHVPGEMKANQWGIVADLQCGGWSTTALNSKGVLFTTGLIDGLNTRGHIFRPSPTTHILKYPPGFTPPSERYDAVTAIRQFSAGRCHILGLADSGRIWSWDHTHRPALHVKFLLFALAEGQSTKLHGAEGRVTKVVAGWNRSSAYIIGRGIEIWQPSNNSELQGDSDQSEIDGMLVLESWLVPDTGYHHGCQLPQNVSSSMLQSDDASAVGQVTNWILLYEFVVFATTSGRLFISKFTDYETSAPESICINSHRNFSDSRDAGDFIVDIQGSYRHFAVFKRDGTVLISDEENLQVIWDTRGSNNTISTSKGFSRFPCLQNAGVISVAVGDHHFHALHSDGTITSYGAEMNQCGALGLGDIGVACVRGLDRPGYGWVTESEMFPEAYATGRKILFEPEKQHWLSWLQQKITGEFESPKFDQIYVMLKERRSAWPELGEWFEERLRSWDRDGGPPNCSPNAPESDGIVTEDHSQDSDDDGLPAYFALSIAAAGWHSGALVLVNEAKASRTRDRFTRGKDGWTWDEMTDNFPRIRLTDGTILGVAEGEHVDETEVIELPAWLRDEGFKEIEQVIL